LRLFRMLGRLERNAKAHPQPRIATHLCYRDDLVWMLTNVTSLNRHILGSHLLRRIDSIMAGSKVFSQSQLLLLLFNALTISLTVRLPSTSTSI
jgi:hypothetical protein